MFERTVDLQEQGRRPELKVFWAQRTWKIKLFWKNYMSTPKIYNFPHQKIMITVKRLLWLSSLSATVNIWKVGFNYWKFWGGYRGRESEAAGRAGFIINFFRFDELIIRNFLRIKYYLFTFITRWKISLSDEDAVYCY